jgi:hypothetical protein
MIMVARVLAIFGAGRSVRTPVAGDFVAFRREIDFGVGEFEFVHGPVRHWALKGLDAMIVRDPHRAARLRDRGGVVALYALRDYHLSRRTVR